jgi:hypothetical protein
MKLVTRRSPQKSRPIAIIIVLVHNITEFLPAKSCPRVLLWRSEPQNELGGVQAAILGWNIRTVVLLADNFTDTSTSSSTSICQFEYNSETEDQVGCNTDTLKFY